MAVSSDIRLCVLNIIEYHFFLSCTESSCLVFQTCPCAPAEKCYSSCKVIKDILSLSDNLMFQCLFFFFLPLGSSLQFIMLLCQVLLLHEKMGKTSCFQIHSSKWKHSPLSFHIAKISTKKKKSPLAHVFLGNRLLILTSSGMKNSLELLFLDDHCFKSPCRSAYLSGMPTIF